MSELQNDATDNLLGSLIIAGHFMIPEVCLFFNYNLYRGNRTTKISASDFAAFASPNFPPLATISSMKTHLSWDLIHRPTHIRPFSIQTNRATGGKSSATLDPRSQIAQKSRDKDPLIVDTYLASVSTSVPKGMLTWRTPTDVACLRIFPGIKPEMLDAVLKLDGLKGLVLETFGAGNAPGGPDGMLTKVFADAVKRGIVIVNVTQCNAVQLTPAPHRAEWVYRYYGDSQPIVVSKFPRLFFLGSSRDWSYVTGLGNNYIYKILPLSYQKHADSVLL